MNPLFFTVLSVSSSVLEAFTSFQQAQAMKAYYDSQADLSRIRTAQKKLEAKEQGVKVLKATNEALGAALAQAAASGILPDDGSALLTQTKSIREGAEDFQLSKLNEEIIQNLGLIEFRNTKEAGRIRQQSGILDAITGFGTDIVATERGGLFSGFTRDKEEEE